MTILLPYGIIDYKHDRTGLILFSHFPWIMHIRQLIKERVLKQSDISPIHLVNSNLYRNVYVSK